MNFTYKTQLLLLLLIGTISVQNSMGQAIKLKAKLDSISIEIGDQVWLSLSAEQNRNDKVLFPSFKDRIIDGIDLIETLNLDTQAVNNQKIIVTKKFLITAFEDSIFTIPAFSFRYKSDTLYTDSLLLMVNHVRIDSAEFAKIDTSQVLKIFDVKEPINTPWTFKEFFQIYYPYILTLFGIALFVALLVYYIRQRKKNKPFIKLPEKPKEPAHLIALRALDELKSKKLWQSDKVKQYYSELSEILRGYIENRFTIHTFEKTSHEVLESLKHSGMLEKELFMELKQLFGFADLAKFAKYIPLADENDMCLKNAYHFVNATALKENVPLTIEIIQPEN